MSSYKEPPHHPPHMTRAEAHRRRQRRKVRRIAGAAVLVLLLAAGGVALAFHLPYVSDAPASSLPDPGPDQVAEPPASTSPTKPEEAPAADPTGSGNSPLAGLTPAEASAMLADPLMVLVNHTNPMPEGYTFDTAKCGSQTSVNNTLQTAACEAFLQMQAAAAADGVTIWMQSGYRSVEYQANLYQRKTQQYLDKGYDEATAKELAAGIVNPPGYSEHNCGLAADLNSPEHTGLDEGFENTAAFTWLCAHAGDYGFILRYPKGEEAEAITEITYEPWHWRYVGAENAARINASGLCFEEYIAALQQLAAKA